MVKSLSILAFGLCFLACVSSQLTCKKYLCAADLNDPLFPTEQSCGYTATKHVYVRPCAAPDQYCDPTTLTCKIIINPWIDDEALLRDALSLS